MGFKMRKVMAEVIKRTGGKKNFFRTWILWCDKINFLQNEYLSMHNPLYTLRRDANPFNVQQWKEFFNHLMMTFMMIIIQLSLCSWLAAKGVKWIARIFYTGMHPFIKEIKDMNHLLSFIRMCHFHKCFHHLWVFNNNCNC